jgi:hypothetical protein
MNPGTMAMNAIKNIANHSPTDWLIDASQKLATHIEKLAHPIATAKAKKNLRLTEV